MKMLLLPTLAFLVTSGLALSGSGGADAQTTTWTRHPDNPVFQDPIRDEAYEVASDPHVLLDDAGQPFMIYTGDTNGHSSIKLARGDSWTSWRADGVLLTHRGTPETDSHKETPFYRRANDGRHQIYYIGYAEESSYEAEVYLAEADELEGPYVRVGGPVVPRGVVAGKDVYCITSPSVVEHEGALYMVFLGWNAPPDEVTEVWVLGAISNDDGRTWSGFQQVETPIGMEGQITKTPEGTFSAVRTGEYRDREAIYFSISPHPFGPWQQRSEPMLIQTDSHLERNEFIAPQLTYDPVTDQAYLFYTGADHRRGWWIMLAEPVVSDVSY